MCLPIELGPGNAALCSDCLADHIDVNALHQREVDHQTAFYRRSTGDVVSAATNCEFQAEFASEIDGIDDIRNPAASRDQRWPFVHHPIVDPPCIGIARVGRPQQLARKRAGNLGYGLSDGHRLPPQRFWL